MALIEPIVTTCPSFVIGAKSYEICLPGGACISGATPNLYDTQEDICRALLAQLQGIMAPMVPFFDVIQAILCLKDIAEATPKVVSDPPGFLEVLDRCLPIIDKLLNLIPQISAPRFIADTLDVLICVLEGVLTQLVRIAEQIERIAQLSDLAAGPQDPIFNIIECANEINSVRLCAVNESLGPIAALIELLNLFLALIGLDPLPTDFSVNTDDVQQFLEDMIALLDPIKALRDALGIPFVPVQTRC